MKVLDFEVNEKTVGDYALTDGDLYIITMQGTVSKYIEGRYVELYEEVWLTVLYDMSEFKLFVTDIHGDYEEIPWTPSERLMEQIEKFVS